MSGFNPGNPKESQLMVALNPRFNWPHSKVVSDQTRSPERAWSPPSAEWCTLLLTLSTDVFLHEGLWHSPLSLFLCMFVLCPTSSQELERQYRLSLFFFSDVPWVLPSFLSHVVIFQCLNSWFNVVCSTAMFPKILQNSLWDIYQFQIPGKPWWLL